VLIGALAVTILERLIRTGNVVSSAVDGPQAIGGQ
jgi:hypothetical protein